jgi:hypothetical protein
MNESKVVIPAARVMQSLCVAVCAGVRIRSPDEPDSGCRVCSSPLLPRRRSIVHITMSQYDLTSKLGQFFDVHLVFPLLEFLSSKEVSFRCRCNMCEADACFSIGTTDLR